VLERGAVALPVDNSEKVAMQVHRVVHHRTVDHDETNDLALTDEDVVAF
jgi:hypothetical protein